MRSDFHLVYSVNRLVEESHASIVERYLTKPTLDDAHHKAALRGMTMNEIHTMDLFMWKGKNYFILKYLQRLSTITDCNSSAGNL
jgi:hypothetical protein